MNEKSVQMPESMGTSSAWIYRQTKRILSELETNIQALCNRESYQPVVKTIVRDSVIEPLGKLQTGLHSPTLLPIVMPTLDQMRDDMVAYGEKISIDLAEPLTCLSSFSEAVRNVMNSESPRAEVFTL